MEDESLKVKSDFDTTMLSIRQVDYSMQLRSSFVRMLLTCFLFLLFAFFMGIQIYLYATHEATHVKEETIIHTQIVETIS